MYKNEEVFQYQPKNEIGKSPINEVLISIDKEPTPCLLSWKPPLVIHIPEEEDIGVQVTIEHIDTGIFRITIDNVEPNSHADRYNIKKRMSLIMVNNQKLVEGNINVLIQEGRIVGPVKLTFESSYRSTELFGVSQNMVFTKHTNRYANWRKC